VVKNLSFVCTRPQACSRFLGVSLDLCATVIVTAAALTVALSVDTMDAGFAGVIIAQSLQLTGIFQFSLRMCTEVRFDSQPPWLPRQWVPDAVVVGLLWLLFRLVVSPTPLTGGELHDQRGASRCVR